MDLEKIAKYAWELDQNTTEEKLALLLIKSITEVNSKQELIMLLNIFFDSRCIFNNELIEGFFNKIEAFFKFEIHNHPSTVGSTGFGGRIRDTIA